MDFEALGSFLKQENVNIDNMYDAKSDSDMMVDSHHNRVDSIPMDAYDVLNNAFNDMKNIIGNNIDAKSDDNKSDDDKSDDGNYGSNISSDMDMDNDGHKMNKFGLSINVNNDGSDEDEKMDVSVINKYDISTMVNIIRKAEDVNNNNIKYFSKRKLIKHFKSRNVSINDIEKAYEMYYDSEDIFTVKFHARPMYVSFDYNYNSQIFYLTDVIQNNDDNIGIPKGSVVFAINDDKISVLTQKLPGSLTSGALYGYLMNVITTYTLPFKLTFFSPKKYHKHIALSNDDQDEWLTDMEIQMIKNVFEYCKINSKWLGKPIHKWDRSCVKLWLKECFEDLHKTKKLKRIKNGKTLIQLVDNSDICLNKKTQNDVKMDDDVKALLKSYQSNNSDSNDSNNYNITQTLQDMIPEYKNRVLFVKIFNEYRNTFNINIMISNKNNTQVEHLTYLGNIHTYVLEIKYWLHKNGYGKAVDLIKLYTFVGQQKKSLLDYHAITEYKIYDDKNLLTAVFLVSSNQSCL